jgi:predicted transposase YbfD/YdcC
MDSCFHGNDILKPFHGKIYSTKNFQDCSKELAMAIRKHWSIESDNWIRDVTLNEDKIKTKS